MANIKISDLYPTGSELFFDSESYMNEISDGELDSIQGGFTSSPVCGVIGTYILGKIADYMLENPLPGPTVDSNQCQTVVTATA